MGELDVMKLLESEFPGEDIEKILQEHKLYFSHSKSEKSKTGKKGKGRRTSNVSRKGVIIPGNERPNTRARSKLPSIPERDKGKEILEGPSEVKQLTDQCAAEILSEQITNDANLAYSFEDEEEEEEITKLTLRESKKNSDNRNIEVITPVEEQISEASGYGVFVSQAKKEYFDKIKNAGKIFMKAVSKEAMDAIKQLHRIDKKTDRKVRRADVSQKISQEKLIFRSGGFIQNLSEIRTTDPSTDEKMYKFFWEELASKNMKSLAPLTTGGLEHSEAQMANIVSLEDCTRLTDKLSEEVLQKHLDEIISVQLVVDMHAGTNPKVKMLYFLKKGKVFIMYEQELALKHWKELEYVPYLLNPKDRECKRWAESIKTNIQEKKKVLGLRNEEFSPKYIKYAGKET